MVELEPIAPITEPVVTITEPAKVEPFKAFASQADYDREIQKAIKANEENAKKKAEKELEAKSLTETQRIQALADEIKAERELVKKERAEVAAKAVLTKLGIKEEDYEGLLDNIISSDVEDTKARAEKLGTQILTIANGIATKQIQTQMQNTTPPAATPNNASVNATPQQEYDALLAKVAKAPNNRQLMQELFIAKEKLLSK